MATTHDEMRDIIIEAAREVFAKYGYKKTTLDDIAASIYKAKSSLYYYFDGKEDVFKAVIDSVINEAQVTIAKAVEKERNPKDKLRAYFWGGIQFANRSVSHFNILQEELFEIYGFANDAKRKYMKKLHENVARILKMGVESGDFTIEDIDGTADALMVAFDKLHVPYEQMDEEKQTYIFECLMNVLLNGLKKR